MNAELLFKALGDDTRLKILRALDEKELYAELIAEKLGITQATVSFHMKKLSAAKLVTSRREQYYTVYTLNRALLEAKISRFALEGERKESAGDEEARYRAKVIETFMPNGYCTTLPAQIKKRVIIYEEIFKAFEPKRDYPERELNAIIENYNEDFCEIRRAFVDMGWMTRTRQGIYRVAEA